MNLNIEQEVIICSAIWYKEMPTAVYRPTNVDVGTVVCGHRHMHCVHAFVALTGKRSVETEAGKYTQGFLTNKNRFVDRIEGAKIALAAGQVDKLEFSRDRLYSEDLY